MRMRHSISIGASLSAAVGIPANAAELAVKLELPQIDTAEYQRPYLAVWVEKADDTFVSTLALWHMVLSKRGEPMTNGDRYLNTLREWWKQSGTTSQMPIDGLSSATRASGEHELVFTAGKAPLNNLAAGKYQLVLEVAREVKGPRPAGAPAGSPPPQRPEGGPPPGERPAGPPPGGGASKDADEVLRVPFQWPVKTAQTLTAKGKAELGAVSLTLKP